MSNAEQWVDVEIASVERGERIKLDVPNEYKASFCVIDAETDLFESAVGGKWGCGLVALAYPSPGGSRYGLEIDDVGDVRLYRRREDKGDYLVGRVSGVEPAGEISTESKLKLMNPEDLGLSRLGERGGA